MNPFNLVIQAVKELYPDTKALIEFNPVIEECGCTTFPYDNGKPVIDISTNIPVGAAVETLAHELAHVIAGIVHGHDDTWEDVFDSIHKKYTELVEKIINEVN